MKNLKWIGITVLVLIMLFFLLAFLLPTKYTVSRSITINKSPEYCFQGVANMQYRTHWDPWLEKEQQADVHIDATPELTGSFYQWEGDTIGAGEMQIDSLIPFKHIYSTLTFVKPQKMTAQVAWHFQKQPDGTKVTWEISGNLRYPLERWFGLFMNNALGKDFEAGLQNLKAFLHKDPLKSWLEMVRTEQIEEKQLVGINKVIKGQDLQSKISAVFAELQTELQKQNITLEMPPQTIYHQYATDGDADITASYPFSGELSSLREPLKSITTASSRILTGIHRGPYKQLSTSYSLLNQYAIENKLPIDGVAWEIYLTNPEELEETQSWKTQIIFPLKKQE